MTEILGEGNIVCKNIYMNIYDRNGFLEEAKITLTDKTNGKDPKNKENYGMSTLKTLTPGGFNIENCLSKSYLYHIL